MLGIGRIFYRKGVAGDGGRHSGRQEDSQACMHAEMRADIETCM